MVPLLTQHDILRPLPAFVRRSHQFAPTTPFFIEVPPRRTIAGIRKIGLVTTHDPAGTRQMLAPKLDAGIPVSQADCESQNEIPERSSMNQERVRFDRMAVARTDNGAVTDRPQVRVTVPAIQALPIEEQNVALVTLDFGESVGLSERRNADNEQCRGELLEGLRHVGPQDARKAECIISSQVNVRPRIVLTTLAVPRIIRPSSYEPQTPPPRATMSASQPPRCLCM